MNAPAWPCPITDRVKDFYDSSCSNCGLAFPCTMHAIEHKCIGDAYEGGKTPQMALYWKAYEAYLDSLPWVQAYARARGEAPELAARPDGQTVLFP